MNDEHLMLLGSIKAHLEHIQSTTDETKDDIKSLRKEHNDRITTLERNGHYQSGFVAAIALVAGAIGSYFQKMFNGS